MLGTRCEINLGVFQRCRDSSKSHLAGRSTRVQLVPESVDANKIEAKFVTACSRLILRKSAEAQKNERRIAIKKRLGARHRAHLSRDPRRDQDQVSSPFPPQRPAGTAGSCTRDDRLRGRLARPATAGRSRPIVITHAHSDHAAGLAHGAACPVYATEQTWSLINRFPLADRHTIEPRRPFRIGRISFETFSVEHSLLAPAVGYRVTEGRVAFFYVPDLASIHERHDALHGVTLYIGDGATVTRSMVRRRSRELIGHATIGAQLAWCALTRMGDPSQRRRGNDTRAASSAERDDHASARSMRRG